MPHFRFSLSGHQNRIMDPGGITLGEILPKSISLESLTVSHNFMMEDAAQALLNGAALGQAALRDLHCEGNLFDEQLSLWNKEGWGATVVYIYRHRTWPSSFNPRTEFTRVRGNRNPSLTSSMILKKHLFWVRLKNLSLPPTPSTGYC